MNRTDSEIKAVYEDFISAVSKAIEILAHAVAKVVSAFLEFLSKLIPPKWIHFFRYSKKRRVRKKYRDKILRCFLAA